MACVATVEQIKLMYRGVPEDGFVRDKECSAEEITKVHKRTGMDFDPQSLTIKGLQIVRGLYCTEQAFRDQSDQHLLVNWETEDFIVFENIYFGAYSEAITKAMKQRAAFPVYICDKTKPHTRFYKAGLFKIIQSVRPTVLSTNSNGHTIRGYLLLQKYVPTLSKWDKKKLAEESKALSTDLNTFLAAPSSEVAPMTISNPEATAPAKVPLAERELLELQPPCSRPTTTLGIAFKSLLEARFATFLRHLGLEFTYEKSMFALESYDRVPGHMHTYHPDFYIKPLKLHVELKPHFPHLEELDLCEQLAQLGYDVVLFYGTAFVPLYQNYGAGPGVSKRHYNQQDALRGMGWSGQNGGRVPGEAIFVDNGSQVTIECVASSRGLSLDKIQSPRLLAAFEAARALK